MAEAAEASNTAYTVRRLTADDGEAYKNLRHAALLAHPAAFGASLADELDWTGQDYAALFKTGLAVGAALGSSLVGSAILFPEVRSNTRHKATIAGMVVAQALRGKGVADELLTAVIEAAPAHVTRLKLSVTVGNAAAQRFYERHGFVAWGTEPAGLVVGGSAYDIMQMGRIR